MYEYRKYESRQEMLAFFNEWLDNALEGDFPTGTAAVSFNIYEDSIGEKWSIELVGTERFDPDGDDWACDETTDLGTRDKPFSWEESSEWQNILTEAKEMVIRYLENGKYAHKLKAFRGAAIGFVEGDLEILYSRK